MRIYPSGLRSKLNNNGGREAPTTKVDKMLISSIAKGYAMEAVLCDDVVDVPAYLKLAGIFAELAIDVEDRCVSSAEELQDFAVSEGGVVLPGHLPFRVVWQDAQRWEGAR